MAHEAGLEDALFWGPAFPRQAQCRTEWWVLWRRVAGGLKGGQQIELYHQVRSALLPGKHGKGGVGQFLPKRPSAGEVLEIWMMLANFEWLTGDMKAELGKILLAQIDPARPNARELWALSRLGARTTVYGPLDRLAPPEQVAAWVDALLAMQLPRNEQTAQALLLLARRTGDRTHDVAASTRAAVADWLATLRQPQRFLEILEDPAGSLRQEERDWIFGESLPSGLVVQGASA